MTLYLPDEQIVLDTSVTPSTVSVGQTVNFTVDAHPNEKFKGVVAPDQPRLNATMTQNVVTYTVVVNTDTPAAGCFPT